MTITTLQQEWRDEPEYHQDINERFTILMNGIPALTEHRQWVRANIFGFGEDSFHWMWKLICDEMPKNFSFLEVGVFRAQIVSLIKLLRADAKVFGITPMDNSGGMWDSDYEADIRRIHDEFKLPQPTIFKGRSDSPEIIGKAIISDYDIVYIDGDHSFEGAYADLFNYAPLVKQGGYLVIDDACNDMKMPWGYFQGIIDVTTATLDYMKESGDNWEFVTNVVHLRVYKRK